MVYVLSQDGKPLMPTTRCGKVYRMLKNKQAKVISKCPFTIQLLYEPETNIVQEIVLGVDTGSKNVGVACVSSSTESKKVLYQSQTKLRDDIKTKMDGRRQSRRTRRNRKTRYRKSRFLNRKNSTKLDRLPPSVKHKIQAHIDEIKLCKKILPISKIVVEISQFDQHLIKNPVLLLEKVKHWGYQQGFNYGFSSRREAILHRDNYTCQVCGKKHTRLEVHHIIYKSQDGTDDETNLITLCEDCHSKVHKEALVIKKKPKKLNLKHATHMSIIRSYLLKTFPEIIETFGFVTKENRDHLSLSKDHYIDACVIASGGDIFIPNNEIFYKTRVSKGDYQLTKGVRGEQKIPTGKIQGFRKFDKVKYLGNEYFIKGKRSNGTAELMDINKNRIRFNYLPRGQKIPKLSNLQRISTRKTILCIRQKI